MSDRSKNTGRIGIGAPSCMCASDASRSGATPSRRRASMRCASARSSWARGESRLLLSTRTPAARAAARRGGCVPGAGRRDRSRPCGDGVLALEVSRFARSSTDWHQLLDLRTLTATLIADADGVYSPAHFNDRLFVGSKGTMSEAELCGSRNSRPGSHRPSKPWCAYDQQTDIGCARADVDYRDRLVPALRPWTVSRQRNRCAAPGEAVLRQPGWRPPVVDEDVAGAGRTLSHRGRVKRSGALATDVGGTAMNPVDRRRDGGVQEVRDRVPSDTE
jgi:hypothetical protein